MNENLAGYGGETPPSYFVYILRCADGSTYTGCTNDLDDRLKRHNRREIHYTKSRLPVELIVYVTFADKYKAYEFEKYLKTGSGRAFAKRHFH